MKITVLSIDPSYHSKNEKFKAIVKFHDDESYFQQSAEVTVFLDKSITDLSEIHDKSIQTAYDFLSSVISRRSSQSHVPELS